MTAHVPTEAGITPLPQPPAAQRGHKKSPPKRAFERKSRIGSVPALAMCEGPGFMSDDDQDGSSEGDPLALDLPKADMITTVGVEGQVEITYRTGGLVVRWREIS